jgi:hypothetical protein
MRWAEAIQILRANGHDEEARWISRFSNTLGTKGGWDSSFVRNFPHLERLLWPRGYNNYQ